MITYKVDHDIAIIGGGFAGLGIAIQLIKNGKKDFIIFERAAEVGGTWRDNIYPGCACDIPSHLYSYSFEMNPNWSRAYSGQPEILEYIINVKNKYKLDEYIEFNSTIVEAKFEEEDRCWRLLDKYGKEITTRTVILAIGPLNVPKVPFYKGIHEFEGDYFHSSEWDSSIDMKDKKVIVVGTGASAIQIVPSIVAEVERLTLFQRSAPWILPKFDKDISVFSQKLFKTFPFIQKLKRWLIFWFYEFIGMALFKDNFLRTITRNLAKKHLKNSITDPELQKKLTPDYQIGCKRRLPSDDFYPSLMQNNVELVTDSIETITSSSVIDKNGVEYDADIIIFATGFHVADFEKRDIKILGRNNSNLFEEWQEKGPEAYYGTCISGFPGLMFLMGPNTGLGHNSQLHIIESQFNYIIDYYKQLNKLPNHSYMDVKVEAQKKFNDKLQKKLHGMVWASGCNSWYLHNSGRNSTIWPGLTASFRNKTRRIIVKDFEMI
ncbi:MAG: NAD(P)/FAD-dependent oxidoreductase [Saprospiraceae bacterium]|nr:NAD(P)/FAD-dependent oxidoreductase [Saprospiraceae bacterium]